MFVLGPLFSVLSLKSYFTNPLFINYSTSLSLVRINYLLPGVFTKSVLNPSINASLWSISLELKLYVGLLVFYLFKIPFKKTILISVISLAFIIEYGFYNQTENYIRHLGKGFILYSYVAYAPYFLIGVLSYLYKEKLFVNFFIASFAFIIACLCIEINCFTAIRVLIIPVLVMYVASLKFPFIKKITSKPDLSYGLYIFAFPLQQIISQLIGNSNLHAWQMCLLCIACTLPFAFFSWYKVERYALSFKNKFR